MAYQLLIDVIDELLTRLIAHRLSNRLVIEYLTQFLAIVFLNIFPLMVLDDHISQIGIACM